jgi:hypothetical protein
MIHLACSYFRFKKYDKSLVLNLLQNITGKAYESDFEFQCKISDLYAKNYKLLKDYQKSLYRLKKSL